MNNLKKIFYGVSFMVLIVMTLVYSLLSHSSYDGDVYVSASVINAAGFTGLPAISIVLMVPAFIFGILAMSINKKVVSFIRDLFGFFSSLFAIASVIISFFYIGGAYYIPIILGVCSIALFIISTLGLFRAFKESDEEQKTKEQQEHQEQQAQTETVE